MADIFDEDEGVGFELNVLPNNGDVSIERTVVFGPESPYFEFLLTVDPDTRSMEVTIGNSPALSQLPEFIPIMLEEVGEQFAVLAERADFLDAIYNAED